jgi:hypothetical protein
MLEINRSFAGIRRILLFVVLAAITTPSLEAQYFGRNKVRYQKFDFKVLETDHFDIYYYDEMEQVIPDAARMAERWYTRLSGVLGHELSTRQPLILYGSHPAFRQTTAIPGAIGEATGGVTEALKRRVVLPLSGPLAESDHVLGHEIVHAFQFDMTGQGQTAIGFEAPGALRLPLWFIEGMAEYLSLGPVDSLTAMWVRDAVRREQLPRVRDLGDPRLFPYRWGQAFWSYVGGRYGDEVIGRILRAAGRTGDPFGAIQRILDISIDDLTTDWHAATRGAFEPVLEATAPAENFGQVLISAETRGGDINVSPSISPDGRYVLFFSERDLFSIDIFMADAHTGRVIRKITETATDPHFESLQFINSAGAWSPDSGRIAIGAISRGRPVLSIFDANNGNRLQDIRFAELGEIFNPTWAPDGRRVAFSAIVGGLMDLFIVDTETEQLTRLTNDAFAEIHPDWSPDGRQIAFATDRFRTDLGTLSFGHMSLAVLEVAGGDIRPLPVMEGGRQINPQWGPDGTSLFFISDHEGISNLYVFNTSSGQVRRVTNLQTGATGIAKLSPALTVANTGRTMFSVFEAGNYSLYVLNEEAKTGTAAAGQLPGNPALLPPEQRSAQVVTTFLRNPATGLPATRNFQVEEYRPSLSLDYIAQPTIGVGVSSFGSFVGGGTAIHWSDMLGHHNLTTIFEAGNTSGGSFLNNISAIMGYQNQRGRWDWGAIGGQVPLMTGGFTSGVTVIDGEPVFVEQAIRLWQINREIQGVIAYPFSEAQRLEFAGGFRNISFDAQVETNAFSATTGQFLFRERTDLDRPDALNLGTSSAALVYDQAVFGGTSPVMGQRYRFEVEQVAGNVFFTNVLTDYRRYFMFLRPLTLAGRLIHFGRYGRDSEDDRLQDLFIGYPFLMRGYDVGSFSVQECEPTVNTDGSCPVFDRLIGSRLAVANLELRIPLFGPLGIVPSRGFLPIETALFYDAGVAWTAAQDASFLGGPRKPVTSYGGSLRINLLGFAIGQVSLVHPNDRPMRDWIWQFDLTPGF